MKNSSLPIIIIFTTVAKQFALLALLAAVGASSVLADIVYVTARPSPCTVTANCPGPNMDGTYTENSFPSLGDYGAVGTASGHPQTTVARTYISSPEITDPNAGVTLTPTLGVAGAVYQIDYNFNSAAGNTSTNVVMTATCTAGGILSFSTTDKFQRSFGNPANQWQFMGFLTNDIGSTTPTIEFRYLSGTVSGAGSPASAANRMLFDCWRFTLVQPCLSIPVVNVTGPLATNISTVTVTNISNTATQINVYQDAGSGMTNIGSLAVSSPGTSTNVTVTGLVKGAQISATQVVGGQEGCVQTTGPLVGGGANPSIRIVLTVRENTALTGPIGAAGSGGVVSFLGASSLLSGGAPEQGVVLQPSTAWQTVSFTNGVDPLITWAGTPATPGVWTGPFGAMDGVAIACEGDNGPYQIYFDDFANGTTVFQDFESQPANAIAYAFSQPSFSGSSIGVLSPLPNDSRVVNTAAASGTKSMRLQFQFGNNEVRNWVRLVTTGNSGAPVNPQLDVNEPISFKVLLLPPGATPTPPTPPTLTATLLGGQPVLNWTGGHRLQASSEVSGTYTNIPGVTLGPWTNNLPASQKFFRLVD